MSRYSPGEETSPLELVQSLLSGRLAPGAHVIITSRPHTLTYLQVTSSTMYYYHHSNMTRGIMMIFYKRGIINELYC